MQNNINANDLLSRATSKTDASSFLNRKPKIERTDNEYLLQIINQQSCHYPKLHFTNMIGNRNDKSTFFKNSRTQVSNFLRQNGKRFSPKEMPFHRLSEVDFSRPITGERIRQIFELEEVSLNNDFSKADYLLPQTQRESPKNKNDYFRIFFTIDYHDKVYSVYLLDPYHLLATTSYCENYGKAKEFDICMSKSISLIY